MSAPSRPWAGHAWAIAAVAACTLLGLAMSPRFDLANIALVYVVAVVVVALRFARGAAVTAAALSIALIDYYFVPPQRAFALDDLQYLVGFTLLLAVALVVSRLTADARRQAAAQAALEIQAETERLRSALLASISHDVRTPLAVIVGGVSALAERGERMPPELRQQIVRDVLRRARDMSEHVAKVLDITRLQGAGLRLDREWAAVEEIAASALRKTAEALRGHEVLVELPPDLPLLRVDAALVEQALVNLLENAARHTPAGTRVRLRARDRASEILLSVEDFGGTLDDARLRELFTKPAGRAFAGGGLGLAICSAIVRLHGGEAWAERLADGATAFCFTLPLAALAMQAPEAAFA